MDGTDPKSVLETYYRQFQKDFSTFLRCRAEELVIGGRMVITTPVRTGEDSSNKEWNKNGLEFFAVALNSMVAEVIKVYYTCCNINLSIGLGIKTSLLSIFFSYCEFII